MSRALLHCRKLLMCRCCLRQSVCGLFYHTGEVCEDNSSSEWHKIAYPKLLRLSNSLRNVDQVDGRLRNIDDGTIITDESIYIELKAFKSLARQFIKFPSVNQGVTGTCFGEKNDGEPVTLNSLTRVCDFLGVSAQQRRTIRLSVCPQVTQHHIWRGALEEVLKSLRNKMDALNCGELRYGVAMGLQIVSGCLKILANASPSSNHDSSSWMRLASTKKTYEQTSHKWGDILEMFNDLTQCLRHEQEFVFHILKLEAMKEGLYQVKEVLIDRDIGYKDSRLQEYLVQKKLSKNLGHSSKCLFTLLLYYLYGSVGEIELDFCKAVEGRGGCYRVHLGKILTSSSDEMVWSGIRQLDRALRLFSFVWETAKMKGNLELRCHVWCTAADERMITYRGNNFIVHGLQ